MLRPAVISVVIGFAAAVAAAVLALSLDREETADQPAAVVAGPLPLSTPRAPAALPAVDVVRIGDGGDVMIAGRALPKADVAVLGGAAELGHAAADIRGEWVFVPDGPLAAGVWLIRLRAVNADGAVAEPSAAVILLVPGAGQGPAFAVRTVPGAASKMLLVPSGDGAIGPLTLAVVDRDTDGHLFVGGHAEANSAVHLYVDNRYAGRVRADPEGEWQLAVRTPRPGSHTLRADQVDVRGKVLARVEQRWDWGAATPAGDPGVKVAEAEGGGRAWQITQRLGGGRVADTIVYPSTRAELRDPDVIYPGQVVTTYSP